MFSEQGTYETNKFFISVICYVAPKSNIHELRGSILSIDFDEETTVNTLLKINFLPALATEVD